MDLYPVRSFPRPVVGTNTYTGACVLSEGLATTLAGLLAFWAISDFPDTAKFLTEDEKAWVIWRKRSDNSSVGEAEGISWRYARRLAPLPDPGADLKCRYIIQALTDWQVWLSTAYYMSIVTPLYGVGLFLPTSESTLCNQLSCGAG